MSDVFISYSRNDSPFVSDLSERLKTADLEVWVDVDGLLVGEEFWPEIARAIDAAAVFLFVISPSSAASKFCYREVVHAVAAGKRVVPVCIERPGDEHLPDAVTKHQWVFFRPNDDTDRAFEALLSAIRADWQLLRLQARIYRKASEWRENEKDTSFLLRGADLAEAVEWRSRTRETGIDTTPLHAQYIASSQQARTRRRRQLVGTFVGTLGVLLVIGWVALDSRVAAVVNASKDDISTGAGGQAVERLEGLAPICQVLWPNPLSCLHAELNLGHGYSAMNRYADAIEQYDRCLALIDGYTMNEASRRDLLGNLHQSRAFSRILLAETMIDRHSRVAQYKMAEQDVSFAKRHYEKTPNGLSGRPFFISEARLLIGLEDYQGARDKLKLADTIVKKDEVLPDIHLLNAAIFVCEGLSAESIAAFQAFAISLDGDFNDARWRGGRNYYELVKQRCST